MHPTQQDLPKDGHNRHNIPEKSLPHWRSTPSTAAAMALPCSAAFSILDMAS